MILQGIDHKEDIRRQVTDSEIIVTALVFSTSFYGNHSLAIKFMKQYGYIPKILDKSRFNRRLHTFHAVILEDFLIKLTLFVFGLKLNKSIN